MINTLQLTGAAMSLLFAVCVFFIRRLVYRFDEITPTIHNLDKNVAVLIAKNNDTERELKMIREKIHDQSNSISKHQEIIKSNKERLHTLEGGQSQLISWLESNK